jgi:hypothetical protein
MAQALPPGLKELLNELEEYAPVVRRRCSRRGGLCKRGRCRACLPTLSAVQTQVPDEVTQHALRQSGYDCKDVRT